MTPQEHYDQMISEGTSHNMAEMLALKTSPGVNGTNRSFFKGMHNGNQWECEGNADRYKKIANEAGVSVVGKQYIGGLAKFPGDPKAWVGSTGDILDVAKSRNLNVSGIVNHKGHRVERPKTVMSEEGIIDGVKTNMLRDPGLIHKQSLQEMRANVIEKHAPDFKKSGEF